MLVMLPGTTRHNAVKLGERIRADLGRVFHKDLHRGVKITLRVAGYPGDGKTADKLLEAVQALEGVRVQS